MVLAKWHKDLEQNKEYGNKPIKYVSWFFLQSWKSKSRENVVFSKTCAWTVDIHIWKRNLGLYFRPYVLKIESKGVTDLNVKHKTIQLLKGDIKNVCDFGLEKKFINIMPEAQSIEEKNG